MMNFEFIPYPAFGNGESSLPKGHSNRVFVNIDGELATEGGEAFIAGLRALFDNDAIGTDHGVVMSVDWSPEWVAERLRISSTTKKRDMTYAPILRLLQVKPVSLKGMDLRGLFLWGADLRWVDFSGADMTGSCLKFADCRSTNLRDTKLTQDNIAGIYSDQHTLTDWN